MTWRKSRMESTTMAGKANKAETQSLNDLGSMEQHNKLRPAFKKSSTKMMNRRLAGFVMVSILRTSSMIPFRARGTTVAEGFLHSKTITFLPHSCLLQNLANLKTRSTGSPLKGLNLSTRDDGLWGSGKSFRSDIKTLEEGIGNNEFKKMARSVKDQAGVYQESKYAGAKRAAKQLVSKTLEPLPEPSLKNLDDKSGVTTSFTKGSAVNLLALVGLGYLVLHPNSSLEHLYNSFSFEALTQFNPTDALQSVVGKVQDMGPMGALYFAGLYILAELLAIPAMPLTASAGYLFGWQEGTAVVLCSATIAASLSFLIARTFLREKVEGLIQQNPRFLVLDKAIGKEGFKLMLLVRLSPIFPFALSNYLYGVTSIPFWQYVWGTLIGFAPGTFLYVYTGEVGKSLLGGDSAQPLWVYGVGLAVFASLLKVVADFATGIFEEIEAAEEAENGSGTTS